MPSYDYLCETCGPFTEARPMAEFAAPRPCPGCARAAPRALLSMPALAVMPASRRAAHATNERSANAPRRSHPSGCGCCAARPAKLAAESASPTARPWMLSH
ncbi:MAG: zinc ribbon domain-containing protein [Acidibrevibacterium sp.]|uniref:FmdB family zinc ribbon protein n=1 Tax=Acidibrevibacterium fodinaquatile TaxID=1969806 RepID=UPI000E0D3AFE|nr:FmdB family zinc ribbon protein [Acidibrevibacterium fodinaquatile]MCA7120637.1 zinc ribbon domain-containing protein [Acidibrevibacterium fodinaquatile]